VRAREREVRAARRSRGQGGAGDGSSVADPTSITPPSQTLPNAPLISPSLMFALRSTTATRAALIGRPAFGGPVSALAGSSRPITCGRPQLSAGPASPAAFPFVRRPALQQQQQQQQQRRPVGSKPLKALPETVGEGESERLTWEGYLSKRKSVRRRLRPGGGRPCFFAALATLRPRSQGLRTCGLLLRRQVSEAG